MRAKRSPERTSGRKRALIIEPQTLFVPFLVQTLQADGLVVLGASAVPEPDALLRLRPDLVFIDADYLDSPPFECIRKLRRRLPEARLVVYAQRTDALWGGVARGLGADVVFGPSSGIEDLCAALQEQAAA